MGNGGPPGVPAGAPWYHPRAMMKRTTAALAALYLVGCATAAPVAPANSQSATLARPPVVVQFHPPPKLGNRKLPFSEAVRVGDLLFLSGKVGRKPGQSSVVPGGIQPETRQTLENIKAVLERNGSSMDRVVKCTVFLADIAEWGKMNEVYTQFFADDPPARSALGASGLALNARVEIECIAVVEPR